jgi:hypothetical protein
MSAQLLLFWIVAMQVMLVLMLEKTISIILAGCVGSRLRAFTPEGTFSPAACHSWSGKSVLDKTE